MDWVVVPLLVILVLAVVYFNSRGPRSRSGWIGVEPVRLFEKKQRRRRRMQEEDRLAVVPNLWVWLLVAFACIWIAALRFS